MATILQTRPVTAAEFQELEFDAPMELVKGELVEMTRPGARHGLLCARIVATIDHWSEQAKQFYVISNDAGVITGKNPDSVRGPDVLVIRKDRLPEQKIPTGWLTVAPDLVVEVLSPNDQWPLVLDEAAEYFAAGVAEVWVVEPEGQSVHVFRQDAAPRILISGESLTSESQLPGFTMEVARLFEGL